MSRPAHSIDLSKRARSLGRDIKVAGALWSHDWYQLLVDDCQAIKTETQFVARWSLVEGYHELGKRVLKDEKNFKRSDVYGKEIVKRLAESVEMSERTIWYAIKFARKFPKLNELPEGKDTSWHKICNKYLPDKKMKNEYITCPTCGLSVLKSRITKQTNE